MDNKELDKIKAHYYELGILEGRGKFRLINFIEGLGLGIAIGILLMLLSNS